MGEPSEEGSCTPSTPAGRPGQGGGREPCVTGGASWGSRARRHQGAAPAPCTLEMLEAACRQAWQRERSVRGMQCCIRALPSATALLFQACFPAGPGPLCPRLNGSGPSKPHLATPGPSCRLSWPLWGTWAWAAAAAASPWPPPPRPRRRRTAAGAAAAAPSGGVSASRAAAWPRRGAPPRTAARCPPPGSPPRQLPRSCRCSCRRRRC